MHGLIPPALHRFDLVGTTIWFGNYVMEAFRQAFNESGIRLKDKEIKAIRGRSKRDAIAGILQVHSGSNAPDMIKAVYGTFQKLLIDSVSEQGVEPVPGTDDVFGWLRDRKVKIALNTGFDRHIISMLLDRVDWSGIVDAVVCGNDVERGRPAPDLKPQSHGADRLHKPIQGAGSGRHSVRSTGCKKCRCASCRSTQRSWQRRVAKGLPALCDYPQRGRPA